MASDQLHCGNDCRGAREVVYDEFYGTYDEVPANDPTPEECEHCPCCCTCLGCEYGPRDGMLLTEQQRAAIGTSPWPARQPARPAEVGYEGPET